MPCLFLSRKISQYSVRSDDDDDDQISYLSAAEEEPESTNDDDDDDAEVNRISRGSRQKRVDSISRSRSENDLRCVDDLVASRRGTQSPYLTVPDQGPVPVRYEHKEVMNDGGVDMSWNNSQSIFVHGRLSPNTILRRDEISKNRNIMSGQNILTGSKLCWEAIFRQGTICRLCLTQYCALTKYFPWTKVE